MIFVMFCYAVLTVYLSRSAICSTWLQLSKNMLHKLATHNPHRSSQAAARQKNKWSLRFGKMFTTLPISFRCVSSSFRLGRCKNSVSAITLTFMLIGTPQSLIRIQREQRQQQRDFKESDFKLLPWKVCLFKEKLLCRIYSSHYFGHLWGWKPFKTKENISSFPTHSYYRGTVSLWRTTCRSWAWMTVYLKASRVQ